MVRMRCPVAAKTALHTAGASGGRPGSPSPLGGKSLATKCTSTSGASGMRSMGYRSKLDCSTRPFSNVTDRPAMVDKPSMTDPSSWFSAPERLTIGPTSAATVTRWTLIFRSASTLTSATSATWPAWLK